MKVLIALINKEWLENVRSGRITIITILFIFFGIMNPAIAKLTPWMVDLMAEDLAKTGLVVAEVSVDALTAWTQFFKNIPMGLLAFILLYSAAFTKEYQTGSLILVLTKGVSRYKVITAKAFMLLLVWTLCYWLSFFITYGYAAYFWDNSIIYHLFFAAFFWWLFGVWTISLLVLFSSMLSNNAGVLLGTAATVLISYVIGLFAKPKPYAPTFLLSAASLVSNSAGPDTYTKAALVTAVLSALCIGISIPIMNKKEL